jgi:subtilisin family serine protease
MNRLKGMTAVGACLMLCGTLSAGEIDQGLEEVFDQSQPGEVISTLVYLWDQADVASLRAQHNAEFTPPSRRNLEVVSLLQETAELTQAALHQELEQRQMFGEVASFEAYWIANIIRVDATEPVIREIAEHPDVKLIFWNMPISNIGTVGDNDQDPPRGGNQPNRRNQPKNFVELDGGAEIMQLGGPEPGVEAVRAPEVWGMGFTGQGVLVATMDTGVAGNHPALGSRWRGHDPAYSGNPQWAWFDPITNTTFPQEFGGGAGHGTHTMGSVLGGPPGDQIGVAPGAQWIHAGVIDRGGIDATIANAILSFQWMAAPTGNAGDFWAVPRVASNSWGTLASHGHPACDETFWQWIDNSEAAGTIQVFSAGNEGTSGLRRPADRAQFNGQPSDYHSVAVAAIDPYNASWPIAGFSSRGPTFCTPDGSAFTKPNISAPGVNTRSAHQNGGYAQLSGTSMASPHVNGVIALMLEACDVLSADQVKQIIYDTAHDLGSSGKNNTYGWGMIDAYEAVNMALAECTISVQVPGGAPQTIDPGQSYTLPVVVTEGGENVVPGSEMLFYRYNGGAFNSIPLVNLGNGEYEAVLPPATCDSEPEFYVQVEGDGGTVRTSPSGAPDNVFSTLVGSFEVNEVFYRDFSSGMPSGWSSTGLWNLTNQCAVGGTCEPSSLYAYYGQTGSCTFNTGGANNGELLSEPINFPTVGPGETATLSFCYNLQTENHPSFDIAKFQIVGTSVDQRMGEAPQWVSYSLNVNAFAGQTRTLRWHFDTIDGLFNDFRGWQVDRVRIEVEALVCDFACDVYADLNCDGVVDGADLLILLGEWGTCPDPTDCPADLNGDGTVDGADLLILLGNWG